MGQNLTLQIKRLKQSASEGYEHETDHDADDQIKRNRQGGYFRRLYKFSRSDILRNNDGRPITDDLQQQNRYMQILIGCSNA
ncbi:hypothetical protein D3C78_1251180 [compost metagenome]